MAAPLALLGQINTAAGFGSAPKNVTSGGVSDPFQLIQKANTPAPAQPQYNAGPDYSAIIASNNALIKAQQANLAASYTPYFNTYQNYLQAGQQAQSAVNPLYTAKLNDYLAQEAVNKQRKQADTTTALGQIQAGLGDTLAASGVQRQRTAADTQTNIDQVNNQQQNAQQDQGTAFDNARLALLKGANDTGSGLTQQAIGQQQTDHTTQEARQSQNFDAQRQAQDLLKTRTFQDLTSSDAIANRKAGEQSTATSLDLDRYIQDLQSQEAQTRNDLEAQRLQDVYAAQQNYERLGTQKFISTLSGQQAANAARAYL